MKMLRENWIRTWKVYSRSCDITYWNWNGSCHLPGHTQVASSGINGSSGLQRRVVLSKQTLHGLTIHIQSRLILCHSDRHFMPGLVKELWESINYITGQPLLLTLLTSVCWNVAICRFPSTSGNASCKLDCVGSIVTLNWDRSYESVMWKRYQGTIGGCLALNVHSKLNWCGKPCGKASTERRVRFASFSRR